jgi:hypothetical protein
MEHIWHMEIILYTMVYPILLTFLFYSNWEWTRDLRVKLRPKDRVTLQTTLISLQKFNYLRHWSRLLIVQCSCTMQVVHVIPILQPIQQICVGIPTPNSDPLQLYEIFIYSQICANFSFRWLPGELHQRIGKKTL